MRHGGCRPPSAGRRSGFAGADDRPGDGPGLLPIALGSGEVGRENEGPMAVVILGGLITSTFLNLLILPTLACGSAPSSPGQSWPNDRLALM